MAGKRKQEPPRGTPPRGEIIIQRNMEDVMPECMMPYSEHVILERALPRVEDGLKPVQRRILYTMHELGITPDKPHRKCARIVGDCLGKYHPHGDSSVYDALARMAQPFVMRGLLVDGHGNFGSIDGDSPAAMRYTEARMTELAQVLLQDIEKDTVNFHLNFDDTQKEPDMLPGRFPNLLVNGASGIAVGLATNIPPHNLGEAIDAVIAQIQNPEITSGQLMKIMPAPDFPTGGILLAGDELRQAYETGRGRLQVRARVETEKGTAGKTLLVIREIPYQVNKAQMLERIQRLTEEKKSLFADISDIRDESDREGMRAVIELRRDADVDRTLAALYRYSDMQVTYGVNIVAIAEGKPMQMGIKTMIAYYIAHQKNVVTRRTKFDLDAALRLAHILEGLIIAVDNLDEVIRMIRSSQTPREARGKLMDAFHLTEIQAQAILDMRLQRLTNLEVLTLRQEYAEVQKLIAKLQGILKSEKKLNQVIIRELQEIRDRYADPRRTLLMEEEPQQIEIVETAPEAEDAVVLLTESGYLRRYAPKTFEKLVAGDAQEPGWHLEVKTDERVLLMTDAGFAYPVKVSDIPECTPKARGVALSGILMNVEDQEKPVALFRGADGSETENLLFITESGAVKRSPLSEYAVRSRRFAAIRLKDGDRVFRVLREEAMEALLLITRKGMAACFPLDEVPMQGRVSSGVRGMTIAADDALLEALQHDFEGEVLLVTDRGYMKRCLLADFDPHGRGAKGVKCIAFERSGASGTCLAGALRVIDPCTVAVTQASGGRTEIYSESVRIGRREDKGTPYVIAVLDDVVTGMRKV